VEDLAITYAKRLRAASHPKVEVVGIASEILALRYGQTRQPLSLPDREALVRIIGAELREDRHGWSTEVIEGLKIMLRV